MQTLEPNQKLPGADIKIHTAIRKQAALTSTETLTHTNTRTDIRTYKDAGEQRQWDQILLHRYTQSLGYTDRRTHRTWERDTHIGIHTTGTQEAGVQKMKHTKTKLSNI